MNGSLDDPLASSAFYGSASMAPSPPFPNSEQDRHLSKDVVEPASSNSFSQGRGSATRTIPSLKSCAEMILRLHVAGITDIGDCNFELVEVILKLCNSEQLHLIEHNSPHIMTQTEPLWKDLCVKDFIQVRIQVEDGTMKKEPKSWRALHREQEVQREAKMEAVLARMRNQYKGYSDDRATTSIVDGVKLAKKRKLNNMVAGAARPKTLMEKARVNSARIKSIYAPPRWQQAGASAPVNASSTSSKALVDEEPAIPPSRAFAIKPPSKKPKITLSRTIRVEEADGSTSRLNTAAAQSPPILTSSSTKRPLAKLSSRSLSPPLGSPSITSLTQANLDTKSTYPMKSSLAPSFSPVRHTTVPIGPSRASAAALNSIFLKPKARRK